MVVPEPLHLNKNRAAGMSKILVGVSLFGGHSLLPLIRIEITNLLKYGEDQTPYIPAALHLNRRKRTA